MLQWLASIRPTSFRGARGIRNKAWRSNLKALMVRYFGLQAGWSDLPRTAHLYLFCIWITAAILTAWGTRRFAWSPDHVVMPLTFAVLIYVFDLFPIPSLFEGEFTLSVPVSIAAVMLLPPPSIPLVALAGTTLAEIHLVRGVWYKKAFNVGQMVIILTTLAQAFQRLMGNDRLILDSIQDITPIAVVWIGYYLLNVGLVDMVIALASRTSFWSVWRRNDREVLQHQLTVLPLGTLLALLIQQQPLAAGLMLIPLFMLRQAHKLTTDLRHRTIDALMAFANSIDARDPSTFQHSQRVAELAKAIAGQMDLPPDEVETIHLAARIHDLGKVGIPDAILFSSGDLSNGEYDTIKEHPTISASIVESFALFDDGHDMIKHHHERYDGQGYPDRLAAEEIPLGARIITVADAYDAMTSDRPYRAGLSHPVALQRIIKDRGGQFDPQVVDAFLEVVGTTSLVAEHRRETVGRQPTPSGLERFSRNGTVRAAPADSPARLPARSEE